jgi:hypothetical protein
MQRMNLSTSVEGSQVSPAFVEVFGLLALIMNGILPADRVGPEERRREPFTP